MDKVTRVGIDLAKKIFRVAETAGDGTVVGALAAPDRAAVVPAGAAGRGRRGDGGVRQFAPLGPSGAVPTRAAVFDDESAPCVAVGEVEQE